MISTSAQLGLIATHAVNRFDRGLQFSLIMRYLQELGDNPPTLIILLSAE
jgi:hypothetical protein